MREAKSKHDIHTAGVMVEIISLCILTVIANWYSFIKNFKTTRGHSFRSNFPFFIKPIESQFKSIYMEITFEEFIQNQGNSQSLIGIMIPMVLWWFDLIAVILSISIESTLALDLWFLLRFLPGCFLLWLCEQQFDCLSQFGSVAISQLLY